MSNMSLDMHVIALFDSIKVGQTEALLSYEKADLEEIRDADGNSVLHVAALCGHVRIVEKLKFICPELFKVTNPEGLTAVGLACKHGKLRVLQWMLLNFSDRLLNDTKPNLLQISTINDQREICLWLCSEYSRRGLSLDFTDDSGNSLVHIATANGSIRCLQVLISSDVKFQTKNHAGKTPREMAQDNNQPVIIGYLSMAESVAHLKAELLLLTSRIYVNQITQTEEQTQTAPFAIQKSLRSVSPKQVESNGDDLDDELVEIMKQGSQLDSRQSSPTSQQNVTSSMIYAESATSEVPSVEADFCRTYLGDEESIRASVIPASMAGSHYEPTSRQFLYSPTITECANEEQMETKTEMRKKISMLGPKLVSPKRTLGSGPVLIGKLESVPEKSPIKSPQKASSSSSDRPSISASTLTPISTPTSTLPKPAKLRTKKRPTPEQMHRQTVHDVRDLTHSKQLAIVAPTLKVPAIAETNGQFDYTPQQSKRPSAAGSLNNLLAMSEKSISLEHINKSLPTKPSNLPTGQKVVKKKKTGTTRQISFSKRARAELLRIFTRSSTSQSALQTAPAKLPKQ